MPRATHCRHHISRLIGASFLIASCGHLSSTSLAEAEQIAASCPSDGGQIAALVVSDESSSRRGFTSQATQQGVIRGIAERTAICGGHLRVAIFSSSTIDVTVFDSDLKLDGATDNARLRKVPKLVDDVIGQINEALPGARERLPDGATDIVGQLQPAVEFVTQLSVSGRFHLEETILTDGIQTAGADLEEPSLTEQQVTELAATFAVPDLTGAQVRLIGIGRQADGALLPTSYVATLKAFHTAVCQRTQATCTIVTDAAGA